MPRVGFACVVDLAAISNHLITRVFEATIIWAGKGEIVDPGAWSSATELGSGCQGGATPEPQSYDLVNQPSQAIPAAELDALMAALADTAMIPAIESGTNTIQRMVVLAYPRTVGDVDPSVAEYIVILEAGA